MSITLSELLQSRDNRQAKQRAMFDKHRKTVLSLTLVMPGSEKRNALTLRLSPKAVALIRNCFGDSIVEEAEYDLETGFEALYAVDLDLHEAKRKACEIEDSHPLGRLLDIDVIGADGEPFSREELGLPARKCLLCNENARVCMRNRTHDTNEIIAEISRIMSEYGA